MLFDDRGTAAQRRAREAGLVLIGSAIVASALAAAATSGVAVYRRASSRNGADVRVATSLAAAFTAGAITAGLLEWATARTRRRLSGMDRIGEGRTTGKVSSRATQENSAFSDAEVLDRLERDVAIDAAYRAATAIWCHRISYDSVEGLLTSRDHWQGHPDGTASLPLVFGCTLHFEPQTTEDGSWGRATFVLDDNGMRTSISTPARLLAHLTGQLDLLDAGLDDGDPYDECEHADFDADPDEGA